MLRFFIADDYGAVRLGLRAFLEANLTWQVIGEAPIVEVIEVKPDIAVIGDSINAIEMTGRAFTEMGCINETCASEAARRPRLGTGVCGRARMTSPAGK